MADISMPGTDGLTAMKQFRKHLPQARVILLTHYGDADLVRHALHAGASGFVLKVYAPTELVRAIRTVADGGTYVSSAIAKLLRHGQSRTTAALDILNALNSSAGLTYNDAFVPSAAWPRPNTILTPRFFRIMVETEF